MFSCCSCGKPLKNSSDITGIGYASGGGDVCRCSVRTDGTTRERDASGKDLGRDLFSDIAELTQFFGEPDWSGPKPKANEDIPKNPIDGPLSPLGPRRTPPLPQASELTPPAEQPIAPSNSTSLTVQTQLSGPTLPTKQKPHHSHHSFPTSGNKTPAPIPKSPPNTHACLRCASLEAQLLRARIEITQRDKKLEQVLAALNIQDQANSQLIKLISLPPPPPPRPQRHAP